MNDVKLVHIIDDDPALRDALKMLLSAEGFNVKAHASARGFLEAVGPNESGCVVTDVRMPGLSGLDLMTRMRSQGLSLPVIIMTAHADVPLAVAAMKAGAVDLLEKPFDNDAFVAALRNGMALGASAQTHVDDIRVVRERRASLTARENEVMAGLLRGQSNKLIARELGISVRTVEVHRANVMSKMQARSLAELVRLSLVSSDNGFGYRVQGMES
jgi:two-component system, LuxR family, response regulator FixJ